MYYTCSHLRIINSLGPLFVPLPRAYKMSGTALLGVGYMNSVLPFWTVESRISFKPRDLILPIFHRVRQWSQISSIFIGIDIITSFYSLIGLCCMCPKQLMLFSLILAPIGANFTFYLMCTLWVSSFLVL